jgi:hypothetical protein
VEGLRFETEAFLTGDQTVDLRHASHFGGVVGGCFRTGAAGSARCLATELRRSGSDIRLSA